MLQGRAHPGLLGSYELERRAVALANTALSVSNWEQALRVPKALGLDPQAADLLQAAVQSRPASLLPQGGWCFLAGAAQTFWRAGLSQPLGLDPMSPVLFLVSWFHALRAVPVCNQ